MGGQVSFESFRPFADLGANPRFSIHLTKAAIQLKLNFMKLDYRDADLREQIVVGFAVLTAAPLDGR